MFHLIIKKLLYSFTNSRRLLHAHLNIENQLLPLIAEGNESAFAELFYVKKDKLYSFILRICGSPQQAEDIVQDMFLKIWTHRVTLPGIENFDAYLFRMSHNHCINLLKRKAQERTILQSIKDPSSLRITEEQVQFRETEILIRNAIDHLPAQQKMVFTLSREQGLNQQEISEKLNITVPTVKSHMTQALRSLRTTCKTFSPLIKSVMLSVLTFFPLLKKIF